MSVLDGIIADAHAHGFRLNNLFEVATGGWQANFRRPEGGTAYGYGDTIEQAAWRALEHAKATLKPVAKAPAPVASGEGLFD
jgi:hypothetical protein